MKRLHQLNFLVKLAAAFLVMIAAWIVSEPLPALVIAALVVIGLVAARVPGVGGYLKGSAILVLMVLLTWSLNMTLQGQPLAAAVPVALRMAARLVATTGAFFFVMETSTPGSILAAASAARFPPMVTLVLSLIFGIIPMLREEFLRIADAQRARGMEIDGVPFHTRLRYALARGVPLLVQSIRMAQAISTSLTVNGFDAATKRTTWRQVGLSVERSLPSHEARPS
ncbi:MAG TPA: energy-coupling factor transporter transmembrane component T [Geminicoccus sp.]|jgi:energy-coupling factor transport system permease protein|uniref:energy-coupling factor transporter transmembrane component T family protein n=1 Tax=Geminicoccus sp. TaxID=2024832 RepID=UPI002E334AC4|nr:energy-coupling factor transporter transmembrane component T [Geminicoccus sp.]HEX2527264.1 energy-coupling factor transporter transmembrane component T [Geminicoccus sp.]